MEHIYYFDGNKKKISWIIENSETKFKESRKHAEYFYDVVSVEQSKYIALHVGIFWGVGRYIIKKGDIVNIMLDLQSMFDHLVMNKKTEDRFITNRIRFIGQLIDQRKLDVQYQLIDPAQNQASKLLFSQN